MAELLAEDVHYHHMRYLDRELVFILGLLLQQICKSNFANKSKRIIITTFYFQLSFH